MTKIAAHCLVRNEFNFLWFSVKSVINHVDKLYLWDTGSTDGTKKIIKLLSKEYKKKINQNYLKNTTSENFKIARQEMLNATKEHWFIVVDGDEIWWEDSIRQITEFIRKYPNKYESIVVPTVNLIGDIYHKQDEKAGLYKLAGKTGHLNLRAVNKKIPGLHSEGYHGTWGWVDKDSKMIQDRNQEKIKYLNTPYLHATFLQRGASRKKDKKVPKRAKKLKYDLGVKLPKDYYYPEALFYPKPSAIPSPWVKRNAKYIARSIVEAPLKKIKRNLIKPKIGY